MKEFLYILFCVVILGLGIFLLNSKGGNDLFLSDYPVYVSPGVDFSKMHNTRSTYTSIQKAQINTRSLIGKDVSIKTSVKSNPELLSQETNSGLASTSTYSGGLGNRTNRANVNNSTQDAYPLSSTPLLIRSGNGNYVNGNQNENSLIAAGSTTSGNSFRSFVSLNPLNDYREGDIIHPGGNPVEEDQLVSVPVGDGLLPFFLMGVFYMLFTMIKYKFQNELHIK